MISPPARSIASPRKLDWLLTLGLVQVSGNPVVLGTHQELVLVAFLAVFATVTGLGRSRGVLPSDTVVLCTFIMLSAWHLVSFPGVLTAELGFVVKLLIAFGAARVIRNLPASYCDVMAGLALLSLAIYVPQQLLLPLGVDLRAIATPFSLMPGDMVHVGLHNFHLSDETRNSGVFWEPGAFAGYLVLAIGLLAAMRTDYPPRAYRARLIVLIAALISTQSTAGYIAAPFALALHIPSLGRRLLTPAGAATAALVMFTIPLLYLGWTNTSFLSEKFTAQTRITDERSQGWEISRLGSVYYDLDFVQRRPGAGWSADPVTREALDPFSPDIVAGEGNGLSGFAVRWGIIGLVVYTAFAYRSVAILFCGSRARALLATAVILLLLNGEQFLNFPLFLALMFIRPARERAVVTNIRGVRAAMTSSTPSPPLAHLC